jgi:hypothetical protein
MYQTKPRNQSIQNTPSINEDSPHLEIGRTPTQTLHIHPPLLLIQTKTLQSPFLTQTLHLIDIFIPSVIPRTGIPLRILIAKNGTQRFQDGLGSEVFGRNENQGGALSGLFGFDEVEELRIDGGEGGVEGRSGGGGEGSGDGGACGGR